MYQFFMQKSYLNFKNSMRTLFLSGLFFGFGVASKWIALYGAIGLFSIFIVTKISEFQDFKKASRLPKIPEWVGRFKTQALYSILVGFVSFVILPAVIYWASYIPYMLVPNSNNTWDIPIKNSVSMYKYHKNLNAEHPYQSTWYEWPINSRPICYVASSGEEPGTVKRIFSFGNPLIWWLGIFSFFFCFVHSFLRKNRQSFVLIIAIICQFLPWILVPRIAFIYHYFSIVPFMILTLVYAMKEIIASNPNNKLYCNIYIGATILLFILFYPILSGIDISSKYVQYLSWLPKWNF
jgi:dolichyl-phosphate-mannose--protein O-mannosyl transferase